MAAFGIEARVRRLESALADQSDGMSPADRAADIAGTDWQRIARPEQIAPRGGWVFWLILAGRGWGKTRTGAEWTRRKVRSNRYVNLIGATAADARDILVEGESGILAVCPRWERPEYQPSKTRLVWPNGAVSLIFSADEPDRLRGKQHGALWADELAAWRYAEAWDQAKLGLRLGRHPQACITTTPRPIKIIRDLIDDPVTIVTRGRTADNAKNLAPAFLSQITRLYDGTRLGRQELNAEILDDNPGALWKREQIDLLRVVQAPELRRIVVAIDPAVTSNADSDETGIVVAGIGADGHGYVIEDLSCVRSPDGWCRAAVQAYHRHEADRVIAETNNGGDLVETVLRTVDPNVSFRKVTASRGKAVRAEPVAALFEQGKVHHVGTFDRLEDQLCNWDPAANGKSPDRLDALVWALTELHIAESVECAGLLDLARHELAEQERAHQQPQRAQPNEPTLISPAWTRAALGPRWGKQ
jgi:phage terminase large subunit-like protein